jgi:tetratricopeptide (TPR) repeat protein
MKKAWTILLAATILWTIPPAVAGESVPYVTYTYDQWQTPVDSPAGYRPVRSIDGVSLGVGRFSSPQDLFVWQESILYILDSGNNRIVRHDLAGGTTDLLQRLTNGGAEDAMNQPQGLFVTKDGEIVVADTGNKRVIRCSPDGTILDVLEKPESALFPENEEFIPLKVAVNSSGIVHVLCKGIYNGAVMFDAAGRFLGFFGSNPVEITPKLLFDRFLKSFMSTKQKEKLPAYIPTEYTNLLYDEEDFLYTCTVSGQRPTQSIRKLNPAGVNILEARSLTSFQKGFGDFGIVTGNVLKRTQIIDIAVDREGFVSAVDFSLGKVFQYDQDANLLFAFSGPGDRVGLFLSPVAIGTVGEELMVLDAQTGRITFFGLTEYGRAIRQSLILYNDGSYVASVDLWEEVLKRNTNCNLAYIGLGKAYLEMGAYDDAMANFRIGHYDHGYNQAYLLYRKARTRSNFLLLFLPILLLIVLVFTYDLPITVRLIAAMRQKLGGLLRQRIPSGVGKRRRRYGRR